MRMKKADSKIMIKILLKTSTALLYAPGTYQIHIFYYNFISDGLSKLLIFLNSHSFISSHVLNSMFFF